MRRTSFAAALAAVAIASPLSAQTWQAIGTPDNSNTGAYWNNDSDDNVGATAVCNVGGILTNTPGLTPGSCSKQAPVFIPLTPAPLTTTSVFLGGAGGSNPGAFRFVAGTYNIGLIGRVAGVQTTDWGIITDTDVIFTSAALTSGPVTVTSAFAIWINQARPNLGAGTVYTSSMETVGMSGRSATTQQQFAVFSKEGGSLAPYMMGTLIGGGSYYVGMEDNIKGGRGFPDVKANGDMSDRDYQDIIISVSSVPEPATIGLMGFGLLALAGVAKRRKA